MTRGTPDSPVPPALPARSPSRPTAALFAVAVAAGASMPLQGRINSALGTAVQDPLLAALISFATGLAVMALAVAALPAGRHAAARVGPALRSGRVRPWQLLAGVMGATLILTQTLTIPVIGVAVFTVAVVTGQVLGGMLLDRLGWTPAGVQRMRPRRVVGVALALASVTAVVWPRLGAAGDVGAWLLLALLPLAGGIGTSGQQVMNGHQTSVYGNPLPATLLNFLAGTAGALAAVALASSTGNPRPRRTA